jgi:hypothetical protein
MSSVSNGKLCGGVNSNVGFRYTVIFPTCENNTEIEFMVPNDFGKGGAVYIDGNFIVGSKKDIW